MPAVEQIDDARQLMRLTLTGTLTGAEMLATVDRMSDLIGQRTGFSFLSDHRGIETPATPQQLETLVEYVRRKVPSFHHQRWAVVATAPASYGMMRMLSVMAERIPMIVKVFHDPADAESWLDLK